ncbi:MAG: nicotinamide riboside transporter PnuC [Gammaproteobacteria bacterium]|nr:nicotinamide riboside transporter PnuC [Gammaproteobacteria bacterium]MDH5302577.1 nicotinamide riboside transporter PnuC [Gammaproteobacteria bacterium]MDH5321056.1 nicotinamide riboside transporter PnuC [Gammaproteobacteria bacterium]
MQAVIANLFAQAEALSVAETLAVLFAVGYLILAIQQNIWCWFSAAASTAIFSWLFFDVRLYMEALLNVFYFVMAIYGWHSWHFGRRNGLDLIVSIWPWRIHGIAIAVIVLLSGISGLLLQARTDAAFPYVDSLTSWGAVWATFLVARKVLENWWYWFAIDASMMFVFWAKGLELTAVLYLAYLVLIPIGLRSWTHAYRESNA